MPVTLNQLLGKLDAARRSHGSVKSSELAGTLARLASAKIADADELVRLHEALLFLAAYPPSKPVLAKVERRLKSLRQRVATLETQDADLSPLDTPEVSGIAGGSVTSNFSYALARWLARKYPRQLSIDWEWMENEEQWSAILQRFLPLLADDAMVEAHVPLREWLRAATGRQNEFVWLIDRFESLDLSDKEKAELYDSLKLHLTWKFPVRASRTAMRLPPRNTFFHSEPLIQRRDVVLAAELSSPSIPVKKLSRREGEKILDLARETSAVRYRELHGFTYGDGTRIVKADLGRGTEAFVIGVPPETRLPLRAYHAAIIFKNGVPVGYFEGLSLFERMESGFNLYYTFREGETAWLYARILRLMRQLLGVTVFSIEPYQIGHENEEGIESGAFWFYRKLGFRPVRPEILKLTQAEELKGANDRRYRTSARTLRKLAAGYMLFETQSATKKSGEWDRFEARNIGLALQRRMAQEFRGDAKRLRAHSVDLVRRALNVKALTSSSDLPLVLAMIPDLKNWSVADKELAARVLSAKHGRDEAAFLKQMQKHALLRAFMIELGSKPG
ncbi:MAG TPA: hypothetical protein VFZ40_18480 [Pyrinomonadaceae bacterium]